MNKKTRLIILLACIVCFFVISPMLVLYSMGDRFDFKKMAITATGGIYVRTFPAADKIIIDSKISEKPGLFANSIFVQSLLPENHAVLIEKAGYYDYKKNIPVEENEVTKLENILLIKKDIAFHKLTDGVNYFSIAPNNQNIITIASTAKATEINYNTLGSVNPAQTVQIAQLGKILNVQWSDDSSRALIDIQTANNNLYYLFSAATATQLKPIAAHLLYLDKNSKEIAFNPQDSQNVFYIKNNTLYSAKTGTSLPIITGVLSFKISGANITWLSTEGAISTSDLSGKTSTPDLQNNFTIDKQKTYEVLSVSGNTFLKQNSDLFSLDQGTKTFSNLSVPLSDYRIIPSPDNKNLIYWNSNKIFLYSSADKKYENIYSGNSITACQWLNNDYVIFAQGDKIIISETDYRGNVNAVSIADYKNPQIFFNAQNGEVYVLADNALLSSEKLIP